MLENIVMNTVESASLKLQEIDGKAKELINNAGNLSKNLPSEIIRSIIKNGGKVKIIHERYVGENPLEESVRKHVLLLAKNAHSKREQKLAAEALSALGIILERNSKSGEFHRHNIVYSFGGTTTVEVTFGNEHYTEKSICALCDNFNRKTGISICINRLVLKLQKAIEDRNEIQADV
jgi:ribosomal protein L32